MEDEKFIEQIFKLKNSVAFAKQGVTWCRTDSKSVSRDM